MRKYYAAHKEKFNNNQSYKYVSYAEKYKTLEARKRKQFMNKRYRVRKRNAQGSHTYKEWVELKERFNNMCLCCKQFEPNITLTEDHIVPLIMGGTDSIDNIQPLCASCNTRKYTKTISYLPSGGADGEFYNHLIYREKGLVTN